MKSRKYNKFRKQNKKTYKKRNKKTNKKHNKKTYKKNKKGGGDDLCVSTEDKPCCLSESIEDPQQGLNQKCNEYYFEEIEPSGLHNYYSWRNPNNLLKKSNSCKKVNIKNKLKRCSKSFHDIKRQERRDLEAQAREEERIRTSQIRDEDNLRTAQQNEKLLHIVGKMRDKSSLKTRKSSMTSKPTSDSRTRKNSSTKLHTGNKISILNSDDVLNNESIYPSLPPDQQETSLDY